MKVIVGVTQSRKSIKNEVRQIIRERKINIEKENYRKIEKEQES